MAVTSSPRTRQIAQTGRETSGGRLIFLQDWERPKEDQSSGADHIRGQTAR